MRQRRVMCSLQHSHSTPSSAPARRRFVRRASRRHLTVQLQYEKAAQVRSLKSADRSAHSKELTLDKHNRLRTGNFKPATAAHVFARQHVVNSHHVVARLLISHPILFIRAARRRLLFGSFQPTNFIFHSFTAMGTTVHSLLEFLFLVEKILFIHFKLSPLPLAF